MTNDVKEDLRRRMKELSDKLGADRFCTLIVEGLGRYNALHLDPHDPECRGSLALACYVTKYVEDKCNIDHRRQNQSTRAFM